MFKGQLVYYEHCLPMSPDIWCFCHSCNANVLPPAGERDEDREGGDVIKSLTLLLNLGILGAQRIPLGLSQHQPCKPILSRKAWMC